MNSDPTWSYSVAHCIGAVLTVVAICVATLGTTSLLIAGTNGVIAFGSAGCS